MPVSPPPKCTPPSVPPPQCTPPPPPVYPPPQCTPPRLPPPPQCTPPQCTSPPTVYLTCTYIPITETESSSLPSILCERDNENRRIIKFEEGDLVNSSYPVNPIDRVQTPKMAVRVKDKFMVANHMVAQTETYLSRCMISHNRIYSVFHTNLHYCIIYIIA